MPRDTLPGLPPQYFHNVRANPPGQVERYVPGVGKGHIVHLKWMFIFCEHISFVNIGATVFLPKAVSLAPAPLATRPYADHVGGPISISSP